jgi:hypothetical protein
MHDRSRSIIGSPSADIDGSSRYAGANPVPILKTTGDDEAWKDSVAVAIGFLAMARLYGCQLSGRLAAKAIGLRYRIGWPTATAIGWFLTPLAK